MNGEQKPLPLTDDERRARKAASRERSRQKLAALTPEERLQRKAERDARRIKAVELRLNVFALRKGGASYRQIHEQLGVSVSTAHKIVDEELQRLTTQLAHSREQLRALELERIDTMLVRLDRMLHEGRKVSKSDDGSATTIVMTRPGVGYFFAYFRALERRARLLGLDMPQKIELSTPKPERDLAESDLDRQIAELRRQVDDAAGRLNTVH